MGIGAFNLVRNSVFRDVDDFERIRMEVVDDLLLGKLIKQVDSDTPHREDISVPWYGSFPKWWSVWIKNTYAGELQSPYGAAC